MKRVLIPLLIIAGVCISTASQAQVYVQAHIGFGVPVHRGYYVPPPPPAPVVYEDNYAPAYSDEYAYDNNVIVVGGPGHRYWRRHRDYDDRYYRHGYGYERREYRNYGHERGRERYRGNEGRHGRGW